MNHSYLSSVIYIIYIYVTNAYIWFENTAIYWSQLLPTVIEIEVNIAYRTGYALSESVGWAG